MWKMKICKVVANLVLKIHSFFFQECLIGESSHFIWSVLQEVVHVANEKAA